MRKWIPAAFVAASFALSAAVWERLPERIPIHWNFRGEIDRWGGRAEGALLFPVLALILWIVLPLLPKIDPRRASFDKFRGSYDLIIGATLALLFVVHCAVIAAALGYRVPMGRLVPIAVGLLFITIGNVLPRTRPNWWMGVRTPWTLSNDRVWARTHRVSGWLMVAAGVLIMLSAFLPSSWGFAVLLAAALGSAFGSIVYSYFAWKQETSR
jgi:uncharacterized membrane protein